MSAIGVAPSLAIAAANETRVRVDGFSKMQAIDCPRSTCVEALNRRRLQLARELEQLGERFGSQIGDAREVAETRVAWAFSDERHRRHPAYDRLGVCSSWPG